MTSMSASMSTSTASSSSSPPPPPAASLSWTAFVRPCIVETATSSTNDSSSSSAIRRETLTLFGRHATIDSSTSSNNNNSTSSTHDVALELILFHSASRVYTCRTTMRRLLPSSLNISFESYVAHMLNALRQPEVAGQVFDCEWKADETSAATSAAVEQHGHGHGASSTTASSSFYTRTYNLNIYKRMSEELHVSVLFAHLEFRDGDVGPENERAYQAQCRANCAELVGHFLSWVSDTSRRSSQLKERIQRLDELIKFATQLRSDPALDVDAVRANTLERLARVLNAKKAVIRTNRARNDALRAEVLRLESVNVSKAKRKRDALIDGEVHEEEDEDDSESSSDSDTSVTTREEDDRDRDDDDDHGSADDDARPRVNAPSVGVGGAALAAAPSAAVTAAARASSLEADAQLTPEWTTATMEEMTFPSFALDVPDIGMQHGSEMSASASASAPAPSARAEHASSRRGAAAATASATSAASAAASAAVSAAASSAAVSSIDELIAPVAVVSSVRKRARVVVAGATAVAEAAGAAASRAPATVAMTQQQTIAMGGAVQQQQQQWQQQVGRSTRGRVGVRGAMVVMASGDGTAAGGGLAMEEPDVLHDLR